MEIIDIVVGFDQREAVAYHVFCQSVLEKTSRPVRFLPLAQDSLSGYQEKHSDGSNAFTYSRFLCPHLMGFSGYVLYADGDMICNVDIAELWDLRDPRKAVQVVKHNYLTKENKKYFGSRNENYPRKNWSSLVIWNCQHPKNRLLSPAFIEGKAGAFLHRFEWLENAEIGELPREWNWLASEYEINLNAKLIHYTLGTPCFEEYKSSEMAATWHEAFDRTTQGKDEQ
jgi:lipopolysaccharide biosynthesis glycosyltransferase